MRLQRTRPAGLVALLGSVVTVVLGATVSNASGTSTAQDSFRCSGQPL